MPVLARLVTLTSCTGLKRLSTAETAVGRIAAGLASPRRDTCEGQSEAR